MIPYQYRLKDLTLSRSSSGCTPLQLLYQLERKEACTRTSTLCVVMATDTAQHLRIY